MSTKIQHCDQCRHWRPHPDTDLFSRKMVCAVHCFWCGPAVMNCGSFKRVSA